MIRAQASESRLPDLFQSSTPVAAVLRSKLERKTIGVGAAFGDKAGVDNEEPVDATVSGMTVERVNRRLKDEFETKSPSVACVGHRAKLLFHLMFGTGSG